VCHHENVTTTRVRTIVTIGLSLRPIVALSGDYRPDSFSPTVVPIVRLAVTDICTDTLK